MEITKYSVEREGTKAIEKLINLPDQIRIPFAKAVMGSKKAINTMDKLLNAEDNMLKATRW